MRIYEQIKEEINSRQLNEIPNLYAILKEIMEDIYAI